MLLSQLFGFQIQMQGGYKMVGFPSSAAGKYFDLLQQEDY
ncbi:MAG: hypothetical protein LBG59_04785 [Candidatus Peribacteria bacterium]|nr:hypothetical protein [Candidatus Peribacteria bacterium]